MSAAILDEYIGDHFSIEKINYCLESSNSTSSFWAHDIHVQSKEIEIGSQLLEENGSDNCETDIGLSIKQFGQKKIYETILGWKTFKKNALTMLGIGSKDSSSFMKFHAATYILTHVQDVLKALKALGIEDKKDRLAVLKSNCGECISMDM